MKIRSSSFYVAIASLFLVALSVNVILNRKNENRALGFEQNTKLERAVRSQANFTEYAPIFLLSLVVAENLTVSGFVINFLGILFFVGRTCHALSLCYFEPEHGIMYIRVFGMMMTFLSLFFVAFVILYKLARESSSKNSSKKFYFSLSKAS
jgi:uncharacterized membrane protein YecN with MAPEG domain